MTYLEYFRSPIYHVLAPVNGRGEETLWGLPVLAARGRPFVTEGQPTEGHLCLGCRRQLPKEVVKKILAGEDHAPSRVQGIVGSLGQLWAR